jgi:RND family efflux transporter MFP subunit
MPAIDWSSPGLVLVLAASGAVLIVLGVLFYFLPPARIKGLALAVGVAGGLAVGTALGLRLVPAAPPASTGPVPEPPPTASRAPTPPVSAATTNALERFRKLTPAERMTLLAQLPDSAAAWHTVRRGDVDTLVERGVLESADNAEILVKVHGRRPGGTASIIKWIIDDGATVKKGQLLVELNDAELREQLKAQQITLEQKKADQALIRKQAELDVEQAQLAVEEAQHQLVLAQRDVKAYTGSDAERKKGLELKVKEAAQLVKSRDFQTTTAKSRAQAARDAAQKALDAETAQRKELEADIAACKMYAPRDGIVFFYVSERSRWPEGGKHFVFKGEAVKEGQKLMDLPDLSKMQVHTRIRESQIAFVRADQTASVRVDAFPDRTLTGKVASVATVAAMHHPWEDVVYPVSISLPDEKLGLKPGMSAVVRIRVEPHRNVPRVPLQALIAGRSPVCFVKVGERIEERPVTTGLSEGDFVEITSGLKEGDEVLSNPRDVARRLAGTGR